MAEMSGSVMGVGTSIEAHEAGKEATPEDPSM
jgi:hypothetical protein